MPACWHRRPSSCSNSPACPRWPWCRCVLAMACRRRMGCLTMGAQHPHPNPLPQAGEGANSPLRETHRAPHPNPLPQAGVGANSPLRGTHRALQPNLLPQAGEGANRPLREAHRAPHPKPLPRGARGQDRSRLTPTRFCPLSRLRERAGVRVLLLPPLGEGRDGGSRPQSPLPPPRPHPNPPPAGEGASPPAWPSSPTPASATWTNSSR